MFNGRKQWQESTSHAGFECLMEENNGKTMNLHAGFECLMEENNGKTKSKSLCRLRVFNGRKQW